MGLFYFCGLKSNTSLDQHFGKGLLPMRRLSVFLLLTVFLSADPFFGEIWKIPTLLHHYFEHKKEDDSTTFLVFLGNHYKSDIGHRHSTHASRHHSRLPFHSLENHSFHSDLVPPKQVCTVFRVPIIAFRPVKKPAEGQIYPNDCLVSIWQPPRLSFSMA